MLILIDVREEMVKYSVQVNLIVETGRKRRYTRKRRERPTHILRDKNQGKKSSLTQEINTNEWMVEKFWAEQDNSLSFSSIYLKVYSVSNMPADVLFEWLRKTQSANLIIIFSRTTFFTSQEVEAMVWGRNERRNERKNESKSSLQLMASFHVRCRERKGIKEHNSHSSHS